jgi:hypothetical protein
MKHANAPRTRGPEPTRRVTSSRARAAARQRALSRLAREFAARYRELYAEERGSS